MDVLTIAAGGSAMQDLFAPTMQCVKCKTFRPLEMFRQHTNRSGNVGRARGCRVCESAYKADRRSKMSPEEKQNENQKWMAYERMDVGGRSNSLLRNAKTRALARNKNVEINRQFVLDKLTIGYCEATGFKFVIGMSGGRGKITPFSPSLDCVEPSEGYTFANTQVVCSMYNIGKNRHSELDFKAMCLAVALRNQSDPEIYARMIELTGGEHTN